MRVRVLVVPPAGNTSYSFLDSENPEAKLEKIIGSATVGTIDFHQARIGMAFDETAGDRHPDPEPNHRAMRLYDTLQESSWADAETLLGTWVFYGLSPNGHPRDVPPAFVSHLDYAYTSIGRLPITAPRGGIKYPWPPTEKGTPVARKTKHQIEQELAKNRDLIEVLRREQDKLIAESREAIPAEPPAGVTMFTVALQYKMRGRQYQFLILRSGGHYWTTGTKKDQQVFSSWEALCEWLEGPEVYSHSDIEFLQSAGKVVSFTSGKVEDLPTGQPPF